MSLVSKTQNFLGMPSAKLVSFPWHMAGNVRKYVVSVLCTWKQATVVEITGQHIHFLGYLLE